MEPNVNPIQVLGDGLNRPECVLTHKSGLIFTSNCSQNGGVSVIRPNGMTAHLLGTNAQNPLKPNGITLEPDGSFLLAHLGTSSGGIFRQRPNGRIEPVVTHANAHPLPPTNFITRDASGRLWITVSTTLSPRDKDYGRHANTGFIAVAEPGQSDAKIVANNLGYTNECVIDSERETVYVNETFARRLSRFDLNSNGTLSHRDVLATFSHGTYPDGLALDEAGNLWVTSIVSNRIIKVSPDGQQQVVLEDSDSAFLEKVENAFTSGTMASAHLTATGNTRLKNISSLAFGGPDRSTAYLGNLLDTQIHQISIDAKGCKLPHWGVSLGFLEQYL